MNVPFRVCLITNRHLVKSTPMVEVVKRALEGGVDCVLLREPELNPKTLVYVGRQFRMLTSRYGAKLIVKDRVDVAQVIGADGVHLGADSIPPQDVRRIWDGLVGYSAHSAEEAGGVCSFVDYIFISPVFHTKSKPMARPIGVEGLKEAMRVCDKPVYPLGGVEPDRVEELVEVGVPGVAAMSVFFRAPDAGAVARAFVDKLGGLR